MKSHAVLRSEPSPADSSRLPPLGHSSHQEHDEETDMWPLNIIFPSGRTVQVVPRHLWLVAAVIATISVFIAYVGLLSGSVERGAAQWRAAQEAGPAPSARAVKGTLGTAPRKRPSAAG